MANFIALLCGLVFGLGLLLSGMTDPGKVLGFLDIAGSWDPSLMFVMGGALSVALLGFSLASRREKALLGEPVRLPTTTRIDPRLLLGAGLFGIGWGLVGICPGPALVLLGRGSPEGTLFFFSMLGGMLLFEGYQRLTR